MNFKLVMTSLQNLYRSELVLRLADDLASLDAQLASEM